MSGSIKRLGVSAVEDILAFFGVPVTTLQELWDIHQERKAGIARDILLEEICEDNLSRIDNDDKISILHRYLQAAMNGEARVNLRILAKLIRGLLNNEDLQPALYASEFNRYAKILEGLSYEELQILATLYKFKQEDASVEMRPFPMMRPPPQADYSPYPIKAMQWLAGGKPQIFKKGVGWVAEKSNGKIFEQDEFKAMVGALARTGLVSLVNGMDAGYYELSPLFFKVAELVDFREALEESADLV